MASSTAPEVEGLRALGDRFGLQTHVDMDSQDVPTPADEAEKASAVACPSVGFIFGEEVDAGLGTLHVTSRCAGRDSRAVHACMHQASMPALAVVCACVRACVHARMLAAMCVHPHKHSRACECVRVQACMHACVQHLHASSTCMHAHQIYPTQQPTGAALAGGSSGSAASVRTLPSCCATPR